MRGGLLITSLPTKAPDKAYPPYQAKNLDIGSFKILLKDGGNKRKAARQAKLRMCRTVPQRRGFSAQSADFLFLPGADHQES